MKLIHVIFKMMIAVFMVYGTKFIIKLYIWVTLKKRNVIVVKERQWVKDHIWNGFHTDRDILNYITMTS